MPQIFLTTGTVSWTVPDDCVWAVIDTIGAGSTGNVVGGAGAGAAWSRHPGLALTPRAAITVSIGASGATGGDTWFNGASLGVASVGAKGGGPASAGTGGTGGAAASRPNSGSTSGNSGGNGGSLSTDAGGGGGAAGPNGNGNNGNNGTIGSPGDGGSADAGFGGVGGTGSAPGGGTGLPGSEFDSSHGCGGGGGGASVAAAGGGGFYGGGGGGALTGGTGGSAGNGLIVINYLSTVSEKTSPPYFKSGTDDPPTWAFAAPYNRSLATSILPKTVLRPPFRVSKPSDDFVWYPVLDNSNKNLNLVVTANPFNAEPFKFNYSEDAVWQTGAKARNLNLVTVVEPFSNPPFRFNYDDSSGWQLAAKARNPNLATVTEPFANLPWLWKFSSDDQSLWQGQSLSGSIIVPELAKKPFVYTPWTFGLDDSSGWQSGSNTRNLNLAASGQIPFSNLGWAFDHSDDGVWQQSNSVQSATFYTLLNLATNPFISKPWVFGRDDPSAGWGYKAAFNLSAAANIQFPLLLDWAYSEPDDSPSWQGATRNRNPNLVSVTEPFANLPWLWKFSCDDSSLWQGVPVASDILIPELVKKPFIYTPWVFGNDDASNWQSGAKARNLNLASITEPLFNPPWLWKFSLDDASLWQGVPIASEILTPELDNKPFIYTPWVFGQDDSSGWQSGAKTRNLNLVTVIEPFVNLPWLWKFSNDDSSGWQSGSKNRNPNLVTIIEPTVNLPWLWKFSYDDASGWTGTPTSSPLIVPILAAKAPGKLWRWDHDVGESHLLILPKGRNPNLVPAVEPFANPPFRFGYDDSSGWQFASKGSSLLVPVVTAGGQTSAPIWKFVIRPFDDPFWQFKGQLNVNVTNRPIIVLPPVSSWSYGSSNPDDTPSWNGIYWRNYTINIQPVHETDPRFVTDPLALNAVLPSNTGSGRVFVTTPKVYGMPYGNDFSTIDPVVESVMTTFNFDPWLAVGETINSVLAVTVSVAKQSLSQDPNPQLILSGAAQIGPVPPAFPGAPSGVANRAVLQEIAGCQAGVVYLLQCLILTSNTQKLNLATHLPCNALN